MSESISNVLQLVNGIIIDTKVHHTLLCYLPSHYTYTEHTWQMFVYIFF